MKKLIILMSMISTVFVYAQSPEGVNYQAAVRDNSGNLLTNTNVGVEFTLLQGSTSGTTVYEETHTTTTNSYGLFNLVLGEGTVVSGDFSTIDWSNGPYFLEVSADASGGTNYTLLGTQQLMSVPYALYSKEAENVPTNTSDLVNDSGFITSPDDADADPTNEIELPATANTGDVLVYDGSDWVAQAPSSGSSPTVYTAVVSDPFSVTTSSSSAPTANLVTATFTPVNDTVIMEFSFNASVSSTSVPSDPEQSYLFRVYVNGSPYKQSTSAVNENVSVSGKLESTFKLLVPVTPNTSNTINVTMFTYFTTSGSQTISYDPASLSNYGSLIITDTDLN